MQGLFDFFLHLRNKKIIILGLNNITESLSTMFPYEVSYYIDVEQKYVGQIFLNKPIYSPEILVKEDPNSIVVIVSGMYNLIVKESLDSLGLQHNVNYWFGANLVEWVYYRKSITQAQTKPVQIVMVDGGLASQMNKYAIGRVLETRLGVHVKYDLTWYKICGMDVQNKEKRLFSLDKTFNLKIDVATEEEIKYFKAFYYYNHGKVYQFDESLLSIPCNRYIDGYLSNYQYFKLREEELRKEFNFKLNLSKRNLAYKKQIENSHTPVAIHIRRGDYIGSVHEIVNIEYYQRAIAMILEKTSLDDVEFFIFSNDMPWVKEFLPIQASVTYVEGNDNDAGAIDMYLMSLCKHFILANSGFGFWAAFLGNAPDKIVITPKQWFNTSSPRINDRLLAMIEGHDTGAAILPDWIGINCI